MLYFYLIFASIWTVYMGFETYVYTRPQSRPYFVGFFITNMILAPLSLVLSLTGGVFQERIRDAYRAADEEQERTRSGGRKTLIG